MTMPARPEGVAVVRQALAGMADALDFDAAVVADMKMAVSEACTNVVVHAYDDSVGSPRGRHPRRGGGAHHRRARPRRGDPAPAGAPRRPRAGARAAADRRAVGLVRAARQRRRGHGGPHDLPLRARSPIRRHENPVTGSVGADGRWDPEAVPRLAGGRAAGRRRGGALRGAPRVAADRRGAAPRQRAARASGTPRGGRAAERSRAPG